MNVISSINDSEENLHDPLLGATVDDDDDNNVENDEQINKLVKPTKFLSSASVKKLKTLALENQKKCQIQILRNKRYDKITSNNYNIIGNLINLTKKKRLFIIVIFILVIFYFNSSGLTWNTTEKIPVIHHSHVPGMKVSDIKFDKIMDNDKSISTTISTNYENSNENFIDEKLIKFKARTTIPNNLRSTVFNNNNINNYNNSNGNNDNNKYNKKTTNSNNEIIENLTKSSVSITRIKNIIGNLSLDNNVYNNNTTILPPPPGYLVWSDKCKMPSIDPYDKQIMKYFHREKYQPCSSETPLTSVRFNKTSRKYQLIIDENVKNQITSKPLDCCYQSISRHGVGKDADRTVSYSSCLSISKTTQIPDTTDNILVKCYSSNKKVYINGHPMMPEREDIVERLENWKQNVTKKPISVLLLGIDSISRVNLIRAMPKTAQYLYDNEWFEMSGYNKMDDNTFPNLMAILTGYNSSTAFTKCNPRRLNALNECPMIWKLFREYGYVTAYAEDEASINTFNYLKLGFQEQPVDYYIRPFLLAAEKNLSVKKKSGLTFCLGYQHSADYIYDYAMELAIRYKNHPYFGLFWANTFSHNDISDCSSMDVKMVEYFKKFTSKGILNDTVIIFFSDHGMRFGPTRKYLSGHLEERLPFMFIWLPQWVKDTYPEFVNGLSVNKNRLTNPYDIHMTLKDILEHSGRVSDLPNAPDCANCQTLLKPVPHSRSCQEISIEDHWCTCIPYTSIFKSSVLVKKLAAFAVNYINEYVSTFKNGSVAHLCGKLHLHDITSAYRAVLSNKNLEANLEGYRLVFTTNPGNAVFEATLRHFTDTGEMEITGSISRLDYYASDSKCISDGGAKKYCHCAKHSKTSHAGARAKG